MSRFNWTGLYVQFGYAVLQMFARKCNKDTPQCPRLKMGFELRIVRVPWLGSDCVI